MGKKSLRKDNSKKVKPKKHKLKQLGIGLLIGFAAGFSLQFIPPVKDFESFKPSNLQYIYQNEHYPKPPPLFEREGYTVSYDGRTKTALWIYEELTSENIAGNADRSKYHFCSDPDVPANIRASIDDYKNSGFDRGHLAAAANHKFSELAMKETFYLSNISPQLPQFNRGYWKNLEKYVRSLTANYKHVKVITGPLYLPHTETNGERYVTYQVIGKNDVAVPTHFFKVIKADDNLFAFVLPNEKIEDTDFESFAVPVEKIEKVSGIIFAEAFKKDIP